MPVGKSLIKVQKSIGKNKHKVHPKGRKFAQLARASLRDSKVAAKKKAYQDQKSNALLRYKFIQDIINSNSFKEKTTFSPQELFIFIEQFIARDDEEIKDLESKKKPNRPTSNKQLLLENKRKLEKNEFQTGFLCCDLTDVDSVKALRNWNGTFGGLNNFKKIRINSKAEILNNSALNDVEMK
ncbi:related to Translation machinery-associated protein 16 [Saccharomycodes ludwigii]|uniref:Related to Translation machinery-associated protein 16 n=1 Tax=Saccharomycodes ludwigii TaxID=36035 RepID=A0A376B8H3_9ASCO|nr:hypothetical protein SCDLUD_002179 [Saccharomycodes ludwigii]KAH3902359.1 hypothetical protein SCDLUD_002179 [Saccharomycodes ludwigii]SSD60966.1 related to Translation machinery-associated protein 16 [Saccharomycodes ludwigii]